MAERSGGNLRTARVPRFRHGEGRVEVEAYWLSLDQK